jgi:hypothetical protein
MSLENESVDSKSSSLKSIAIITAIIFSTAISTPYIIGIFRQNNSNFGDWLFVSDVTESSYTFSNRWRHYFT